jgi:hypothetical protein
VPGLAEASVLGLALALTVVAYGSSLPRRTKRRLLLLALGAILLALLHRGGVLRPGRRPTGHLPRPAASPAEPAVPRRVPARQREGTTVDVRYP